eukprot:m.94131 g.94131  ORF g.94131 m.94131 type:complete len:63 (-) comp12405_c0_seq1:2005-2193(-)
MVQYFLQNSVNNYYRSTETINLVLCVFQKQLTLTVNNEDNKTVKVTTFIHINVFISYVQHFR